MRLFLFYDDKLKRVDWSFKWHVSPLSDWLLSDIFWWMVQMSKQITMISPVVPVA